MLTNVEKRTSIPKHRKGYIVKLQSIAPLVLSALMKQEWRGMCTTDWSDVLQPNNLWQTNQLPLDNVTRQKTKTTYLVQEIADTSQEKVVTHATWIDIQRAFCQYVFFWLNCEGKVTRSNPNKSPFWGYTWDTACLIQSKLSWQNNTHVPWKNTVEHNIL